MSALGPKGRMRVFAYGAACDMRKSFNTLAGLVTSMGHEVAAGDVFLFVGRRRRRAKVLWYDGTGLCLLAKRLDRGRFASLWKDDTGEVPLTMNVLLRGPSGSGKSALAIAMAEQLLASGYSVCVLDLEGDYVSLAERPGVIRYGNSGEPPAAGDVTRLLRHRFGSAVIDLATWTDAEKGAYCCGVLAELRALRQKSGLPHWIFIDEAHVVAGHVCEKCDCFSDLHKGLCLVTYHAWELHDCVRAQIDWTVSLDAHGNGSLAGAQGATPRVFAPSQRNLAHVRHWAKHVHGQVPGEKRFHFRTSRGLTGESAGNLRELTDMLARAGQDVLAHHAAHHDLSRWVDRVLQDATLAAQLRAIEQAISGKPEALAELRAQLIHRVQRRYNLG